MGKRLWLLPVADRGLIALDAVLALLDLAKLNPGIRRFSEMNVDHRYSTGKIKRELGWEPEYSLEESIRATVGAYRRQGGT
jgi:nucleoside-diphosphate-sugar epimerase